MGFPDRRDRPVIVSRLEVFMQIIVDEEKCCAAGQCVLAAPDVFDQREEDGIVIVLNERPDTGQYADVRQAAALCPAAAILVRE
jgi:ferredoxin